MHLTWLDDANSAFLAVSFSTQALLLILVALHCTSITPLRAGIVRVARELWTQIMTFEDLNVEEEIYKQVLQTHKRYCPMLLVCTLGSTVSFQWSMISGRVMIMPKPLCWTILMILIVSVLLTFLRDRLIKRNTLHFWYCCGTVIGAVTFLPGVIPESERLLWSMAVFCFYRIPATAMATRLWLVIASNLFFSSATLLGMMLDTEYRRYQAGGDRVYVGVWLEGLLFVLTVGAAVQQRLSMRSLVKQKIRQTNTERELEAATSLLNLTCDAVVELGDDLKVAKHSPDLATLLLRNWLGSSLEGCHFSDFLPTGEVARTVELLGPKHSESSGHGFGARGYLRADLEAGKDGEEKEVVAQAFHTKMVDSCGSQFRTEVFHVKFVANGSTRHLMGVRDFTDQGSLAHVATDAIEGPRPPPQPEATMESSLESAPARAPMGKVSKKRVAEAMELQKELNLLEIDMDQLVVSAGSFSMDFLVGKEVEEIFKEEGLQLLTAVQETADLLQEGGELATRIFSYGDCALNWKDGQTVYVSGVVHVCKKRCSDRLRFVMSFGRPSSTPRARSSRRRAESQGSSGSPSHVKSQTLTSITAL